MVILTMPCTQSRLRSYILQILEHFNVVNLNVENANKIGGVSSFCRTNLQYDLFMARNHGHMIYSTSFVICISRWNMASAVNSKLYYAML
jgi:hypothetical protein